MSLHSAMGLGEMKKEDLCDLARLVESAEQYEDMCEVMKEVVLKTVKDNEDLSVEERNLLSVAYKNVVGARRASLRTVDGNADSLPESLQSIYQGQLRQELNTICTEILSLLKDNLIKPSQEDEGQVFYLKMAADYYRYLAECLKRDEDKQSAKQFYKNAFDIASRKMKATHPIRLGLALNFSVCLYEIVDERAEACALAKEAFDKAISCLDELKEADYKDSTLIMQLLRDNLTLWTTDNEDDDRAN